MRGDLNSEVEEPRENTGNETVLMRHTVPGAWARSSGPMQGSRSAPVELSDQG